MSKLKIFDVADYLDSAEMIAAYLDAIFQDGNEEEIRSALNDVARSKGITDLARTTGLSREAIYKALGEDGNPTLSTLMAILKALGLKIRLAA
ncbi:MAG: hypothetical protein FD163_1924 [Hyphomonadaceae bacterium]|nr:MAG: hypothetical protein FD128_1616 [Hyphomonadaceae bacterium]KAF0184350.1 MAG: hypothetical protein FD163_1924 [Hyphomonadaceae bacterium]